LTLVWGTAGWDTAWMRRLVPLWPLLAALLFPLPAFAGWDDGAAAYRRADWPTAARELAPLAERGDARAQALYGRLLLDGKGVAKDEMEAVRLLQASAGRGVPAGQMGLASALLAGRGGLQKDPAAAIALLQRAADAGDPEALHLLGTFQLFGTNTPRDAPHGVENLQRAAQLGWGSSQELLGIVLLDGLAGQPRDPARGVALLRQASDQGMAIALFRLGAVMVVGDVIPRDVAAGIEMLRKAAEKGNVQAASLLGQLFWNGTLVQKDRPRAVPWLRQAAEGGVIDAQNLYSVALWFGDGIAQDRPEAVVWARRAAEKGLAAAQNSLGEAYRQGIGVGRDPVEAYSWFLQAIANAKTPADKAVYEASRTRLAAELQPADLDRARDLAVARSGKPVAAFASTAAPTPPSLLPPIPAGPPNTPPAPTPAPQPRQLGSAGTGFFVGRDGTAITDSHVVAACRIIRVTPTDSPRAGEAAVVARDSVNDLAVLKTSLVPADIARFREDKPMRPGDGVVAIGYPLSNLLSREANVTVGVISAMGGPRGDTRFFQITAPIQKGNSGGPLADMSGNVVGIVQSKLNAAAVQKVYDDMPQNIAFATKADLLRRFLTDNGIPYQTATAKEALSAADVGERMKRATAFIECLP